jgi:hypothetical protein
LFLLLIVVAGADDEISVAGDPQPFKLQAVTGALSRCRAVAAPRKNSGNYGFSGPKELC